MHNKLISMSPVARAIPFDPTGTVFTVTDVQSALIEALDKATGKTRFDFEGVFNGNATTGRYLEIAPGTGSDVLQFIVPINSEIVRISCQTASSTGATTIGVFKLTNLVTPIASIVLPDTVDTASVVVTGAATSTEDKLAVRVTVGSRSKPFMRVWFAAT